MTTFSFYQRLVLLLLVGFSITSCGDDIDETTKTDYSDVLTDLTNDVIVDTYNELDANAMLLVTAVTLLETDVTSDNLEAARAAWKATRAPWEKSEGFLFGPVDTEGIDPALDSWPVNQVDLENVLQSSDELTTSFVGSLEGTLKGFHTVEFLLWGADGLKTSEDLTERELDYLISTTEVLAIDAAKLATAWNSTGGNFAVNVIDAGEDNSIYISQKSAIEELANGILGIADEVGNGKINDPLEQEDFSLEESQFSDNSKTDFTNNIISIQNIYQGLDGEGLSFIVAEIDSELDTQIKSEIQSAIDAIQAIPGTFTEAIPASSASRSAAESAQTAVRLIQSTFESQLIPLISAL